MLADQFRPKFSRVYVAAPSIGGGDIHNGDRGDDDDSDADAWGTATKLPPAGESAANAELDVVAEASHIVVDPALGVTMGASAEAYEEAAFAALTCKKKDTDQKRRDADRAKKAAAKAALAPPSTVAPAPAPSTPVAASVASPSVVGSGATAFNADDSASGALPPLKRLRRKTHPDDVVTAVPTSTNGFDVPDTDFAELQRIMPVLTDIDRTKPRKNWVSKCYHIAKKHFSAVSNVQGYVMGGVAYKVGGQIWDA
jgi:hypothetical protein